MRKQKAPFKVLVAIVRREKTDFANKLLQKLGVCSLVTTFGLGVDRSGVLELLGLKNAECTVIFGLADSTKTAFVLGVLEKELNFQNPDNGMALSIDLSAIAKNSLGVLTASCKACLAEKENKQENTDKQDKEEKQDKVNLSDKQEKEGKENKEDRKDREEKLDKDNKQEKHGKQDRYVIVEKENKQDKQGRLDRYIILRKQSKEEKTQKEDKLYRQDKKVILKQKAQKVDGEKITQKTDAQEAEQNKAKEAEK